MTTKVRFETVPTGSKFESCTMPGQICTKECGWLYTVDAFVLSFGNLHRPINIHPDTMVLVGVA